MTFSSAFKAVVMMALISIVNARINYPDKLSDISRRDLSGNLDIECHDCTCFSCTGTTDKGDGTMDVTFGHCKDDPGDSLSWMCCVGYDGGEGNCNVVGPCTPEEGTQKCEDIAAGDVLTVNVPTDTETVSINTHDGRTAAAADMDNAVCGGNGNQGGVCAALDATSHCLIHFAIENCGNTPSPTTSFPTTSPTVPGATTPAPAPTPAQPTWGGSFGDPHIRTWAGEQFDFHGGCDLVLVNAPNFLDGLGLEIHIRTRIKTWWSYIESAVIRLGDETFEVKGGQDRFQYWINGTAGTVTETGPLESTLGGFPIHFRAVSKKQNLFRVTNFAPGVAVALETYNDFVRVNIHSSANGPHFAGSVGLMGSYPTGTKVGRDGETLFDDDTNAFGQEWQVLASESKLFHATEGVVQHPEECEMPKNVAASRRLREGALDTTDAKAACAHVRAPKEREACIFDVLATNDRDMASSYTV